MKDGKQKDLFKSEFSDASAVTSPILQALPTQALYLHGLGSGPQSSKARLFREYFGEKGVPFHAPDINIPSFEALSPHSIISSVKELLVSYQGSTVVFGASFGGYIALHAVAALPPEERRSIAALVLLAPAIDPWLKEGALLTPERISEWRIQGSYPLLDYKKSEKVLVHFKLVSELEELGIAPPVTDIRTVIIHGLQDEVVPVRGSREYVRNNPSVQLYELQDDHALLQHPHLLRERVDLILGM